MTWYARVLASSRFASFHEFNGNWNCGWKELPTTRGYRISLSSWKLACITAIIVKLANPFQRKTIYEISEKYKKRRVAIVFARCCNKLRKSQHGGKTAHIFCYCQGHTWGLSMQCEKTNQIFTSENANLSHSLEKNEMKNSRAISTDLGHDPFLLRAMLYRFIYCLWFSTCEWRHILSKIKICFVAGRRNTLGVVGSIFFLFFVKCVLRIGMNWCKLIFNVLSKILGQFHLNPVSL